MSTQIPFEEVLELAAHLNKKRKLLDELLDENKEFEEVKVLFHEIRDLEKKLKESHRGTSFGL